MPIPILPMTTDADNELLCGPVYFDVLTPKMKGEPVRMRAVKSNAGTSDERGTVLVMDVKGLQRRDLNDVLLKRLRIRGMNTWFLTNIESVDDLFDAFNTDAEAVLVPSHTVRSQEELDDILDVSDSAMPVVFVRKRNAVFLGVQKDHGKVVADLFDSGFRSIAVFDTDGSLSEDDWISLRCQGDILPCSFAGNVKGERFGELGFERYFTAPE